MTSGLNVGTIDPLVGHLFEVFRDEGVPFCHWKSNATLEDALLGDEDLDLLVPSGARDDFIRVADSLGFVQAHSTSEEIQHWLGLSRDSMRLIHVHVYFSLQSGGLLAKPYALGGEAVLLESLVDGPGGTPIPAPSSELALLSVRKLLEHASLLEYLILGREEDRLLRERDWLLERTTPEDTIRAGHRLFPDVDPAAVAGAIEGFIQHGRSLRNLPRGLRLAAAFSSRRSGPRIGLAIARGTTLAGAVAGRVARRFRTSTSASGGLRLRRGVVVPVVGGDGSGKSTTIANLRKLFSREVRTRVVHPGSPPALWWSWPVQVLLPAFRRLAGRARPSRVLGESFSSGTPTALRPASPGTWFFALRCALLSVERRSIVTRAARWAAEGDVVLADRYPSTRPGGADGPMLSATRLEGYEPGDGPLLWRWLSRFEANQYGAVVPADLLMRLSLDVAEAIRRNEARDKEGKEDSDYVRGRHEQIRRSTFAARRIVDVDAGGSLEETIENSALAAWSEIRRRPQDA